MIALYVHTAKEGPKTLEKELLAWAKSQQEPTAWYRDQFDDARPHFDQLLVDVRAGKVHKIAVWRLDQLGCNGPALVKLLDELSDHGVGFVSLTEGIDLVGNS